MKHLLEQVFLFTCATVIYLALPIAIVAGWVRWVRHRTSETPFSVLSLSAFGLATCSAFLAVGSVAYAHAIGEFPFYDLRLLRIYRWGSLLSLGGVIFGIVGVWRRSPLRWYAPVCAAGTLLFWFFAASSE